MRTVLLLLVVALVSSQVVEPQDGNGPKKSAATDTPPSSGSPVPAPSSGAPPHPPSPSASGTTQSTATVMPSKPARYSQHSAEDPGLQQPEALARMESPLFLGAQMEIQPDPVPPPPAPASTGDAMDADPGQDLIAEDEELVNKTETLLQKAEKLRFEGVTDPDQGLLGAPDISAAAAAYREAALLGSAEAVNALGELLLYGEGGRTPDFSLARLYFDKAAEAGLADAQHNRGFMYAVGLGFDPLIPQNETAAGVAPALHALPKPPEGDWEEEPVEESSPQEVAHASALLKQGRSGTVDEAKAILNYYFAAMNGSPRAQVALGYRHLIGHGVPKSCEAAIKYYTAVAEKVVHDITDEESPMIIERLRLADENTRTHSPNADADVIQYYQSFAEAGDMHAQFALGQLHFYGARGVPRDLQAAHRYFEQAARQGDAPAMSNLGQMLIQGVGVPQNNETAVKWFREAAEQGEPSAMNGLGFAHLHGRGVDQDYKQALKFFKQASDKGNADAQFNLGVMYFAGLGVEKNYGTALQYFTQASHAGHTRALFNLGQMHMNGFGTVPNCGIAVKFLKTVAERGPWATALAEAHRSFLEGHFEQALLTYARSAEEGVEVAQANAAWMLDQGLGFPYTNARELAFHFYQHAAKQGNVDAQRMLGDYYYYGWAPASSTPPPAPATTDVPKVPTAGAEPLKLPESQDNSSRPDYEMAAQHYLVAANKMNAQAMFNLGYMHEHGIGLKQDFHLAQRYYDQSVSADVEAFVPVRLALLKLWVHRVLFHYAPWTLPYLDQLQATAYSAIQPYVHSLEGESRASAPFHLVEGQWHAHHADSSDPVHTVRGWLSSLSRSLEKHASHHGTLSDVLEDVILYLLLGLLAVLVFLRSRPR